MSKNISIADDVYERLKREKGDRSFSELIEDTLDERTRLADVHGEDTLDPEAVATAREEIDRLSDGTLSRLDDETL